MTAVTKLEIAGPGGRPVPHTFVRQSEATSHLGMLLPGYGYRATMPLLYYAGQQLLAAGADVLRVEYAYDQQEELASLSEEERSRLFFGDVAAAWRAGLGQRGYQVVTLVGKSMGTLAMAHLLTEDPQPDRLQAVWLTPLLGREWVRAQIEQVRPRSLIAIGTADPRYDPTHVEQVREATRAELVLIEGANHSLDIPGDVVGSVRALERVMEGLAAFLARVPAP
jgi:pimeloyl-ACP methyl ester carboxylesterase